MQVKAKVSGAPSRSRPRSGSVSACPADSSSDRAIILSACGKSPAPSTLTRIAKGGGTPESIADTRTTVPPAVDDAYVYWVEGNLSNGIATAVKRAPKATTGAGTTTLSDSYATAIAVDDAYVYWLKAGNVVRRAK